MTLLYYHQKVTLPYSTAKIIVKGTALQNKSNDVTLLHSFRQVFNNSNKKSLQTMSYKCFLLPQSFPLFSETYLEPSWKSTRELFCSNT